MTKMSDVLRGFVEQARASDSFWVEEAKLQFAMALETQRKAAKMTYKAVADKLGTSAAYITKIFRGDSNVTIESMVKLARATGGRLEVRIVEEATAAQWDIAALQVIKMLKQTTTRASETQIALPEVAANNERFALAA
jgi:transcriptional regulator with XRE-family HTH domain